MQGVHRTRRTYVSTPFSPASTANWLFVGTLALLAAACVGKPRVDQGDSDGIEYAHQRLNPDGSIPEDEPAEE